MTRTRFDLSKVARLAALGLGGLLVALSTGCKWANLSGPQSTIVTEGPVAKAQLDVFMVTVYVTTFIFIVVGSVLAYAQIRFRAKSSADEKTPPPPQGHGNPFIELGLIVASISLLVIIAIPTLKNIWYTHDVPEAEKGSAMDVTAHGYQWWFKFEYNTERTLNPDGTEGGNLVTGNELVVPVNVPVRVHLRTVDVIHSFWVPKLAGKVDMIPNRANQLWFKAEKPGYYYGQCAEYCGESHAIMRFRVIALSPSDYVKWLDNQKRGARDVTAASLAAAAETPRAEFASFKDTGPGSVLAGSTQFDADPFAAWKTMQKPAAGENAALIAKGKELFGAKQCMNCHTVRGHANASGAPYGGLTAPDLTHVGARSSIAAGVLENTDERLAQWLKDPAYFKPGNKMVHGIGGMAGYLRYENGKPVQNISLTDADIQALVAYLHSLK